MTATERIRVLIVEDSLVVQAQLMHVISADPRLEVIGCAGSGEDALKIMRRVIPDVVSMDIQLPGINGLETTRRILREQPVPVVIVANLGDDALNVSMQALRAGALSIVEKPNGQAQAGYEVLSQAICDQLVLMSGVKVISQSVRGDPDQIYVNRSKMPRPRISCDAKSTFKMLGIVASTGGPSAVVRLLNDLPTNFPLPILLVQHIGEKFVDGFVRWLATTCSFAVKTGCQNESPSPGTVYVAPGHRHLILRGGLLAYSNNPPVAGQRPSGTVLLRSMAEELGPEAIGVVLTGMGDDGAEGLLDLRLSGGYTIAEDASTAVVYGMPAAASRLGAVCSELPISSIANQISYIVRKKGGDAL